MISTLGPDALDIGGQMAADQAPAAEQPRKNRRQGGENCRGISRPNGALAANHLGSIKGVVKLRLPAGLQPPGLPGRPRA